MPADAPIGTPPFKWKYYSKLVSCPLPRTKAEKKFVALVEQWKERSQKYVNTRFPDGSFFRTHKLHTTEKYDEWDKVLCFFGLHVDEFVMFGITPHCACCNWYHNTTLAQRIHYWRHPKAY